MMKLAVSCICDVGRKRTKNQDAILICRDEAQSFALFLVADGMGGYADGERASGAIVSGMRDWAAQLNVHRFSTAADMLCAVRCFYCCGTLMACFRLETAVSIAAAG